VPTTSLGLRALKPRTRRKNASAEQTHLAILQQTAHHLAVAAGSKPATGWGVERYRPAAFRLAFKEPVTTKRSKVSAQSRMFHSIVLMGSGLALGCGGVAKVERGNPASSGSASTSLGGTAGLSAGGAGSALTTPSAGSANHGDTISFGGALISPGGAPNSGVAGSLVTPLPCPPAQWTCSPIEVDCPGYGGLQLSTGANCKCDTTRPASAADCGAGLIFICMAAERDANGIGLARAIPYGCSCIPASKEDCDSLCYKAYSASPLDCYFPEPVEGVEDPSVLCACATIILK